MGSNGLAQAEFVDTYRFLRRRLCVRSNSIPVLDHLQHLYGRFFSARSRANGSSRGALVTIADDLDASGRLVYDDSEYCYEVTRRNGVAHVVQRRRDGEIVLQGRLDPVTLVQSALITSVALNCTRHRLLHAGVVSWQGRGIVIIGGSGAGKTTLVLRLTQMGCRFLSDEVAALRLPDGLVDPFPRRVNVRPRTVELLKLNASDGRAPLRLGPAEPVQVYDPEDIVPGAIGRACRPRLLILLRGIGDRPCVEPVEQSEALFEVARAYVATLGAPGPEVLQLVPIVRGMNCLSLVSGSIDETARHVLELAETATPPEGCS